MLPKYKYMLEYIKSEDYTYLKSMCKAYLSTIMGRNNYTYEAIKC